MVMVHINSRDSPQQGSEMVHMKKIFYTCMYGTTTQFLLVHGPIHCSHPLGLLILSWIVAGLLVATLSPPTVYVLPTVQCIVKKCGVYNNNLYYINVIQNNLRTP